MAILPTIHGDIVVADDIGSIALTDTFVYPDSKFHNARIPIHHPQLRNLVTSPEPHLINYASGRNIFQHNLKKNTLTLICTLPAKVRCTSSGYGFICAGCGDVGLFALITINPHTKTLDGMEWGSNEIAPKSKPQVKLIDYGEHILNSVNIDLVEGNPALGINDDAVAVLTSNDRTIRFFSLAQQQESVCLDLAFPVNHASISPDGNTLVAVGDYQRAYFFEKWQLSPEESKISTSEYASNHIEWLELRLVDLHVAKMTPVIGYFATAWSPSGKYCAVASECGYITVFDMDKLLSHPVVDEPIPNGEAPVFITPSSRPDIDCGPGAVRAMTFSPGPYDLLIWMEGQGRVCVADLREGLRKRQVIHLDPSSGTQVVPTPPRAENVNDGEDDDQFAHQNFRDPTELMATIASRRQSRLRSAAPPPPGHPTRTRTSATVLNEADGTNWQWIFDQDALHLTREPASHNYEEGSSAADRFSYNGQLSTYERILMDDLSSAQQARREYRRTPNVAELARYHYPHLVTERIGSFRHPPASTGLHDVEPPRATPRYRREVEDVMPGIARSDIDQARQRARRLRKAGQLHLSMENMINQRTSSPGNDVHGVHMTGLCLTGDSRTLYIGTERGFFELSLNLSPRLFFPAINMR